MPKVQMAEVNNTDNSEDGTEICPTPVLVKKKTQEVNEQNTDDQDFKENYSAEVLARTTTLRLKASFHLINYIMMSVCYVMLGNKA